ncbi:MAG: carboxypeptidase-like regulatory domain-containing protein, partial [Candidatus Micrarchaeota archaeon]|nr:carboxypeptidase-like regulatory domain-containing protein [Candidatus Micrarchaeota archaeon]
YGVSSGNNITNVSFIGIEISNSTTAYIELGNGTIYFANVGIGPIMDIHSTDAEFVNLSISNADGIIYYPSVTFNTSEQCVPGDIGISNNLISVDSVAAPALNESAKLTFYGVSGIARPTPYRDGVPCPGAICSAFVNMGGGKFAFNVSSFTDYSIGEGPVPPQQPTGGEEKPALSVSVSTSGYVADPVTFTVTSEGKKVADARVYVVVAGSDATYEITDTGSDGKASATIYDAGNYYAYARKSGYKQSSSKYFTLSLRDMSITVPNEVYGGTDVEIVVKDSAAGTPLPGADVQVRGPSGENILLCTTGAAGTCIVPGSSLQKGGVYAIEANKQYYTTEYGSFAVSLRKLDVRAPSSVYTRERFDIYVSSGGSALSGVDIRLGDDSYVTDAYGYVRGVTLDEPGIYALSASKGGYEPYEGEISATYPPIIVNYPNETYTKENFTLTITSPDKGCISGVKVQVGMHTHTSDKDGKVNVRVEQEGNYSVVATKAECGPYNGVREILDRPPEKPFEPKPPIKDIVGPAGLVGELADALGLEGIVKPGCYGVYIEGIPAIFCDLLWLVIITLSAASAYLQKDNMRRVIFGFGPIIIAVATIPAVGAVVATLSFGYSYREWSAAKGIEKVQKEESEKAGRDIIEGKKPGDPTAP